MSASSARVAAVHRGGLELITESGTQAGFVTGRLRHEARSPVDLPAVGDHVTYDPESGAVQAVRERTSALVRAARNGREAQVLAANVDLVVVVASLNRELNLGRIERMLTLAADAPAQALVVLSKADLAADPDARVAEVRAALAGAAPVLAVSTVDGTGIDAVAALLGPGVTGVLLGASGVGKTTLLNALSGGERATGPIREADDRGRHTTTHARARAAGERRRGDRHARAQAPAHLGAGERARERVRRRRGARARVPLRRLRPRRRARLRGRRGARRRPPGARAAGRARAARPRAGVGGVAPRRARPPRPQGGDAAHPPRAAADPESEGPRRRSAPRGARRG